MGRREQSLGSPTPETKEPQLSAKAQVSVRVVAKLTASQGVSTYRTEFVEMDDQASAFLENFAPCERAMDASLRFL